MTHMVNTYSTVERSGIYICGTCDDNQMPLYKGEEAPGCSNCKNRPVTWMFWRTLGRRPIGFVTP